MPLFFIPAIFAIDKLAYRLGHMLGAGAAQLVGRQTSSSSTTASSSAWLVRCLWSLCIVVGTYGVLAKFSPRLDSLPALLGTWLALLLLPRPTPRLFLVIARFYVLGTTITSFATLWFWATKQWTIMARWEGAFVICWWSLTFAMVLWAFLALRRHPRHSRAIVQVIPRPLSDFSRPPLVSFENLQAETSHTQMIVRVEWATQSSKVSVQVRTEKQVDSARFGRES